MKIDVVHFIKMKLSHENNVSIPNYTIPPKDVQLDDIVVPEPTFSALIWHNNEVVMQDKDRTTWSEHDSFQTQFKELDDALRQANQQWVERHGEPAHKRQKVKEEEDELLGEPPHKKLRTDDPAAQPGGGPEMKLIDAADIDTEILRDVHLHQQYPCGKFMNSGSSNLVLKICSNGALYMVNTAAADDKDSLNTKMHANSILVGYSKGKWQKHASGDNKEIRYILQDSSEAVVFNGQVVTVGALVSAKHLTAEADAARVCYHEIVQDPKDDDKSAFYLRPAEEIHYVVQDVPVKVEGAAEKSQCHPGTCSSTAPTGAVEHSFHKDALAGEMGAQEGVAADTTTNHMGRTGYCNPSWQSGEVDAMNQMVIRLSVRQWTGPDGLSQRRKFCFC